MNSVAGLFKSTVGKKIVMAVTGLVLFAFVVGHLLGNLQVFGEPGLINNYGHFLKSEPLLLWGARFGLLAAVLLHIWAAVQLSIENKAARPVGYSHPATYGSTWRSRNMLLSGLVIAAFVIYHLAHFTVLLKAVNGVGDFTQLQFTLPGGVVTHDVYGMMILGFQVWWVVLFYLVAMALLFAHLSHGLASMFQSLGLRSHAWWPRIQCFAKAVSIAILIGYCVIPISIYMRVIGSDYAEKIRHKLTEVPPVLGGKEAK